MKLTFHGGAGRVTGANYLLESDGKKILIDCGLIQGGDFAEAKNFEPFQYDPAEIDAVFITHAHIDHTGRLPKLVRDGFKGKIYSTNPTKAFSDHLLRDSVDILCREAERHRKDPFCMPEDVDNVMRLWAGAKYHEAINVGSFRVTLYNAGHILGSSFIKVEAGGKSVVISGDLGNSPTPLIREREALEGADYCLVESAYGGREHEPRDLVKQQLERVVDETVSSGGVLMIPAFALERTQILLYYIHDLINSGKIKRLPVFLDSPLAIKLTDVYSNFTDYFDEETKKFLEEGHGLLNFSNLIKTKTREESKEIIKTRPPKIIMAGAGMSQGGRIIYHEKEYLPSPQNSILFVGYQVRGSLGRKILDGQKEINIFGQIVPIRAKVRNIPGFSAHADQAQLLSWLLSSKATLKKVFLVQGETDQSEALKNSIVSELTIKAEIPQDGQSVELV